MKTIFSKRSIGFGLLVVGIAGLVAAALLVRHTRDRRDQRMTSSCANHAIQLRFLVMQFVQQEAQFPSDSDTRSALQKLSTNDYPVGWFSSLGSSCPESYLNDGSIGYVFVADGLPAKVVAEDSALVLFCPAESHQRSEQHCHAVVGDGGLLCIKSNVEMIELLRQEIGRAKHGVVPYSTNALSKMERELKAREEYARERGPNKSVETNRRPASPLRPGQQFGSASRAPPSLSAAVAHLCR